ncbi:MAG: MBL fold metallo-hydrolase [Kiritimatiellae bacterium]|nr:MBL fold metallo-hydrolase [Kiritimatiellia bacterium]
MHIETLVVSAFQTNCYLVWGASPDALVIDPGDQADGILARIRARELRVAAYLLTHGHVDHVSALAELYDAMPAPVGISAKDAGWAFSEKNQIFPYSAPRRPGEVARLFEHGQEWTDAGLAWRVVSTPGHTPGGVCLHFPAERILFTGDTLFAGSVGRTDLPGGHPRMLAESLKKLAAFPDETRVYPGHGPPSTIGEEKRTNFYLRSP